MILSPSPLEAACRRWGEGASVETGTPVFDPQRPSHHHMTPLLLIMIFFSSPLVTFIWGF